MTRHIFAPSGARGKWITMPHAGRTRARYTIGWLAVILALFGTLPFPVAAHPIQEANRPDPTARDAAETPTQLAPPDDEIVLITADGRIQVVDPFTPTGYAPVTFSTSTGGWQQAAVGDVNGDGEDEIVAVRGGDLRVFDPVVPPGSTPAGWHMAPPEGWWTHAALGDVDGDGQEEIVAVHASRRENVQARVLVLDPNATATDFRVVFARDLEVPVMEVDTGDVDGDGWGDVVIIGNIRALFYAFSGGMWDTLFYWFEPKPWRGLAVGQTHRDSARAEIAVIREVPQGQDSYFLHQWVGGGNTQVLDKADYYPNMDDVALADMNGDGDDEILFVRSDDTAVPLVVRNPAGYVLPRDISIWTGPGWKRVAGGDFDGDGLGEIIILKETAYRIYTEPEQSDANKTTLGAFQLHLAVGNLDGAGVPTVPILRVSANSLAFIYEAYTLPPAQAVTIENEGAGGSVPWAATIVEGEDWLRISPTSGNTPGTLTVSVEPWHLRSGTYQGRIQVTIPGALRSPQEITVLLTVITPVLQVIPQELQFDVQTGHPPLNQPVAVYNVGVGGDIGWRATVVGDTPWLNVDPPRGTTPGEFVAIIDPTRMAPGSYTGYIRVQADDPVVENSPITVTVTALIRPPVLSVAPASIYVNVAPGTEISPPRVYIQQAGVPTGHAIRWVAGVIPSVHALPDVAGKAITRVGPEGVTFGTGGEAVVVPPLDWVTLEPWYGTTPSVMFVRLATDRMAPGLYRATIIVDGGEGTMNRFQGVDLMVMIPTHHSYLPLVLP